MINVVVSVTGTQQDDAGDEQRMEFVTAGRYYRKNGIDYFTYDESELTGLEGTTTLLKVYDDYIVLVRMGAVEQRQEFRLGERSFCTYITPYGTMKLAVETNDLSIALNRGSGQINIAYQLEIDGQWQSSNRLAISIREEKKRDGH